jgi:hypothetical protein
VLKHAFGLESYSEYDDKHDIGIAYFHSGPIALQRATIAKVSAQLCRQLFHQAKSDIVPGHLIACARISKTNNNFHQLPALAFTLFFEVFFIIAFD